MEIGEKLLELRKKNNLSQEALAEKLGVARQTISKWELGETSPDLKESKELAKIFNVTLDELVGNNNNINKDKKTNTEKLAGLILNIYKISLVIAIIIIFIIFLVIVIRNSKKKSYNIKTIEESIYCKIYGEEHGYNIKYEFDTGYPVEDSSDGYFNNILDLSKYKSAKQILDVINDYVKKNNGSCMLIKDRDLSDFIDIEIKELTNTSMTIIIHDNSTNRISYGEDFYIEKYINGSWISINTTGENYAFNAIAYYTDENGILELNQNWTHMYGDLDKGIYRIIKNVFFDSDVPVDEKDKFYIWQEFEIE